MKVSSSSHLDSVMENILPELSELWECPISLYGEVFVSNDEYLLEVLKNKPAKRFEHQPPLVEKTIKLSENVYQDIVGGRCDLTPENSNSGKESPPGKIGHSKEGSWHGRGTQRSRS